MNLDVRKLKLLMAKKQMNIGELAIKSGLSSNSISSFFSERRKPSIKSLGKLASGLGVEVEELLGKEAEDAVR